MLKFSKSISNYTQIINNCKFVLNNIEKRFIKTSNCDLIKKKNKKIKKSTINDQIIIESKSTSTIVSSSLTSISSSLKNGTTQQKSTTRTRTAPTASRVLLKKLFPISAAASVASHFKETTTDTKFYSEFRYFENIEQDGNKDTFSSTTYNNDDKNGKQFTIMSYNILAQDLLELHPHLYLNHTPENLLWENRLERLCEEILYISPEILCLQEVQQNHLPSIHEKLMKLNFDYIYKKETGIRTDGCAIFYNKNLFNLIEHHDVEYYQPNIEHLDRENVAIIAKFNFKSHPDAIFLISTTHLLYNPRRQDVRLAQIQVLLAELDRLSIKEILNNTNNDNIKRIPIILTGDFNLQPYSAPYRLITMGNLQYYNLTNYTLESSTNLSSFNHQNTGNIFLPPRLGITDNCQHFDLIKNHYQGKTRLKNKENRNQQNEQNTTQNNDEIDEELRKNYPNLFSSGTLKHSLNFSSVYNHIAKDGELEGTTYQNKWITVDYIFYNNNKNNDQNLKLISHYTLPSIYQCRKIGRIPNSQLGSDHLSLAAKFFLNVT